MKHSLTPRQKQAFDFIDGYIAEHDGIAPTYAEIGTALGLKSGSTPFHLIAALKRRGFIENIPGNSRSFRVVNHLGSGGKKACPHCGHDV